MLIEIDARCNLKCEMCARALRKGDIGAMEQDTFKNCIDILVDSRFENYVYAAGFGESMLNSNFLDMIRYAKLKGCKIVMPTNATMITDETLPYLRMLDSIHLSIDSFKDKKRRTQNPNDILKLIPEFKSYGIQPWFNITLGSSNWGEIDDFINFGLEEKVIINFVTPRPHTMEQKSLIDELKFVAKRVTELEKTIEKYPRIFCDDSCRSFEKCEEKDFDIAVAWNGDLYPCSAAFFYDYKFGNINDCSSLDDFWDSSEMQMILKGNHPVCDNCKIYDKEWNEAKRKSS